MKAACCVVAAVMGSATAFVPAPAQTGAVATRPSTGMKMAMDPDEQYSLQNMSGATAPVPYWDPLGFAAQVDGQELQKYREAELKHGRVAMLAALGMIVQEAGFHPFFGTAGVDLGPAAFHLQKVGVTYPQLPLLLLVGVGAVEAFTIGKGWSKQDYKSSGLGEGFVANLKSDYFPGDLGFDPLGLYPQSEEGRRSIRAKELNNGRLAMIAIWGMWLQELTDGNTLYDHYVQYGFGPAGSTAGVTGV